MGGLTTDRVLAAILRTDFNAFVQKVFATVSPGDVYRDNWHIEAISYELMRCRAGKSNRLVITQPPRSLKSICTSVAFVAFMLGHDPKKRFICVSYSRELAETLSRQFRMVVESKWYRELFPAMRLKKVTSEEITTTKGGGRIATSIGGTLTGRGADIIIIDDPLKAEDALSETARKAVITWYTSTLVTRLNDKAEGVVIIVMQRLHEEDLAGHVLESGLWQHLNLPAIAIEDQDIRLGPEDWNVYHRKAEEVLHPAHEPRHILDSVKADIGSLLFSAQYQQSPIPVEGNLVKREWFQWYEAPPEKQPGLEIVQSWDIAGTENATSDWSVCTTWAIHNKTFHLLHVWRGRLEIPKLRRKIIELQEQFDATAILIEKTGLGLPLYQGLRDDSPPRFPDPIPITPEGDKLTRMQAETISIEAGNMYLPKEAPWLDAYLHELLGFPGTKHDDQVDSTSQFLCWARKRVTHVSRPPPYLTAYLAVGEPDYY